MSHALSRDMSHMCAMAVLGPPIQPKNGVASSNGLWHGTCNHGWRPTDNRWQQRGSPPLEHIMNANNAKVTVPTRKLSSIRTGVRAGCSCIHCRTTKPA